MQNKIIFVACVALAAVASYLVLPVEVRSQELPPAPQLSSAQVIWIAHLMQCESTINPKAVNPKDVDGTPSIGILQFKQGTFDAYTKKYGLTGGILDGTTQVTIVTKWLTGTEKIDWAWQFPDCVKRYGWPPE